MGVAMTKHALVAAAAFVVSCVARGNEGIPTRPMEEPRRVRVAESFPLRIGEAATVEDAEITVTFREVSSDSRCPKDVNCIQAGEAIVLLAVDSKTGQSGILELAVPPGGESPAVTFEGVRVTIVRLEPEPESTKSIDPADYVATVRVEHA
jgi:hypothetical protein